MLYLGLASYRSMEGTEYSEVKFLRVWSDPVNRMPSNPITVEKGSSPFTVIFLTSTLSAFNSVTCGLLFKPPKPYQTDRPRDHSAGMGGPPRRRRGLHGNAILLHARRHADRFKRSAPVWNEWFLCRTHSRHNERLFFSCEENNEPEGTKTVMSIMNELP